MFTGKERNLCSWYNKYLYAGKNDHEWNRTDPKGCEAFEVKEEATGHYSFKSKHGRYLSAQSNGSVHIKADKVTNSELFTVTELSPGTYTITSSFGKFLAAHQDGRVSCDGTLLDESVLIRIQPYVQFEGIRKMLYSYHKKYLSAQPAGTLEWNRTAGKEWEEFEIIRKGDRYAFLSTHGRYITVSPTGEMTVNANQITEKELFKIVNQGGDMFLLIGWNTNYVTPCPDGKVICQVQRVGQWEPIRVTAHE
jgi:hypothetical protein